MAGIDLLEEDIAFAQRLGRDRGKAGEALFLADASFRSLPGIDAPSTGAGNFDRIGAIRFGSSDGCRQRGKADTAVYTARCNARLSPERGASCGGHQQVGKEQVHDVSEAVLHFGCGSRLSSRVGPIASGSGMLHPGKSEQER